MNVMNPSSVNVLRYTALLGGVVYGVYHQATLRTKERQQQASAEYRHQATLVEKAKAEWSRKTQAPASSSNTVINDPDDPKFDLEAWLKAKEGAK